MPRFLTTTLALAATCLLPVLALQAQQPPPGTPANQPAAKAAEKKATTKSSDPVDRIKEEGLKRSQVMATLSYLTDVIGPRLTGSPNLKRANEWTRDKLAAWGLANAHLEAWGPFGRGWSLKRFSAQVIEPQCIPLIGFPKAWSPGTDGTLAAPVVYFDAKTEADFAKYKGKLKGAIVLTSPIAEVAARWEPLARPQDRFRAARAGRRRRAQRSRVRPPARQAQAQAQEQGQRPGRGAAARVRRGLRERLRPIRGRRRPGAAAPPGAAAAAANQPRFGRFNSPEMRARMELQRKKTPVPGRGRRRAAGRPQHARRRRHVLRLRRRACRAPRLPTPGQTGRRVSPLRQRRSQDHSRRSSLAKEHYNRLVRMCEQGEHLKMVVDLAVQFHDDDLMAYNTVAEIPGTDLKDEVVMLGGHMDSWHSGTGATDNGAGVSVAMEVVRILKALDLKPRRTIRIGLWTGEEEGLLGSRAYVREHFGRSPANNMFGPPPANGAPGRAAGNGNGAATTKDSSDSGQKAEYDNFSAYFNLDNGTGKIRGVYMQGNEAVRPIFRKWLVPFREMGAADPDHLQYRRDRPPVVRRHRPARLPVHSGRDRVRHPDPPLQPGRLRSHPGRRHEAGRRHHGRVRVQRGHDR